MHRGLLLAENRTSELPKGSSLATWARITPYWLALVLPIVLSACKSATVAEAKWPTLVVREPQSRNYWVANKVTFPACEYEPDFQTKNGVYFKATKKIVTHALGTDFIARGGLFVPFAEGGTRLATLAESGTRRPTPTNVKGAPRIMSQTESERTDFRHGVWFDHQEGSGGLAGFAASSPKNVYRFDEPISYEIKERKE